MASPQDRSHDPTFGRRIGPLAGRLAGPIIVLLVSLLFACSSPANEDVAGDNRPDAATWAVTWDDTREIVPHLDELSVPPDTEVCQDTVAELRSAREDLFPTPDELIDVEVEKWLEKATSIFFECFQSDIGAETVTQGYAELARLAEEVDTALASVV